MTKTEFARYLTDKGYPSENDGGVVMVKRSVSKSELANIKKLIKEAGYKNSYGYTLAE